VTSNTALKSGSSKHGNARRQSVGCIWLVAMTRSSPSAVRYVLRYHPRSLSLRVPVNANRTTTRPGATARCSTTRSVSASRWNSTGSPSTVAAEMSSSIAFMTISSCASITVASMATVPVNDAAPRSGSSTSS
jgi:hypothetical protein